MASSSALPAGNLNYGIELTDRKSAQYDNREFLQQHPSDVDRSSDSSDNREDASKSTNIDRYNMERMGKHFPLPVLALY